MGIDQVSLVVELLDDRNTRVMGLIPSQATNNASPYTFKHCKTIHVNFILHVLFFYSPKT